MNIQSSMKPGSLGRPIFSLVIALTLLPVLSTPAADASADTARAKPASTAGSTPTISGAQATVPISHDLSIVNGQLIWNGPKRKDSKTQLDATLNNVVELLRELHPEANFIISPGVGDADIADLRLRNANAEESLQAICIASGRAVIWRNENLPPNGIPQRYEPRGFTRYGAYDAGGGGYEVQPAIDPTTGLPLAHVAPQSSSTAPQASRPLYVLDANPNPPAVDVKPKLEVEAFSLAGYFESQFHAASSDEFQALAREEVQRLQLLIERTVERYNDLNRHLNPDSRRPDSGGLSVSFHDSAKLLVVMGHPEAVTVAAKIIGALPGVKSTSGRSRGDYGLDPFTYGRHLESPAAVTLPGPRR